MLISCILCFVFLGIVPLIVGQALFTLLNDKQNKGFDIPRNFILGYIFLWSILEIISIPVTMMKQSFYIVIGCAGLFSIVLLVFGIKFLFTSKESLFSGVKKQFNCLKNKENIIAIVLLLIVFCFFIYKLETTFFFDEDDSRFVVNAIDIVRTNRILATDPTTGLPISYNYDDFNKDLIGQWASFLAFSSKLTGMHVTIFAHTIYPIIAIVMLMCVLWKLFGYFIGDDEHDFSNKCLLEILILWLYAFGYYSIRSSETFTMIRVWQGKATLSSIGILLIVLAFTTILKDESRKFNLIFLLMTVISACFMSSMGIVITGLMVTVYGVVIVLQKKDIRFFLYAAVAYVPIICLFLLSELYTLEMYIN